VFFPVSGWFAAFVLTLAVELPIAVLMLRRAEPELWRRVALVVFANLLTHPAVWYVFSQLFLIGTIEYVVAAEAWAIAVEAVFYVVAIRGLAAAPAVAVAVVANVVSFGVGRGVGALSPDLFG
jgi:hypothetical protein